MQFGPFGLNVDWTWLSTESPFPQAGEGAASQRIATMRKVRGLTITMLPLGVTKNR